LDWSRELEGPLFDCLLCGACTANCFPAIPTSDLIVRYREAYLERVGRKQIHRLLFDTLLPYPNRLRLAARSAALGKKTGLTDAAEALGMLRIFGQESLYTEGVLTRLTTPPFRHALPAGEYPGKGKGLHIGYFVGCGADILNQEASAATFQILENAGERVSIVDSCCCGLPAYAYGDLRAARKMASRNLDALGKEACDVLVTDCASCASFLKKYPSLFERDTARRRQAETLAGRTRDLVEFLGGSIFREPTGAEDLTVTYHDPCHGSRGQGLGDEPRNILRTLPGVTYREMPEADWCCGGAGAYALSHRALSLKILDRKIENFRGTGADMLVTSCPACIIQLSYGMHRHGLSAKVRHISEVIQMQSGQSTASDSLADRAAKVKGF